MHDTNLIRSRIKGTILDENGKPLPFASIYIQEKGTGTSSNLEGKFEMPISASSYSISFQFMGYESIQKRVQVTNEYVELEIQLKPQVYQLPTFIVDGKAEDPAIMKGNCQSEVSCTRMIVIGQRFI